MPRIAEITLALALALVLTPATHAETRPSPVPVLAKDKHGHAIVAYFGPPEVLRPPSVDKPAAGGFYRVLHGRDGKGCDRIQDFYQDSGTRRTSISTTCGANLFFWDFDVQDGKHTEYRPNGQVRTESTYKRGDKDGVSRYYDNEGKVRMSTVWHQGKLHGPFTAHDASGLLHIEGVARNGKIVRIQATDHGKVLGRTEAEELMDKADWESDVYR